MELRTAAPYTVSDERYGKALALVLDEHRRWISDPGKGHRLDLRAANLTEADFRFANLQYAFLQAANLDGADLRLASYDSMMLTSRGQNGLRELDLFDGNNNPLAEDV